MEGKNPGDALYYGVEKAVSQFYTSIKKVEQLNRQVASGIDELVKMSQATYDKDHDLYGTGILQVLPKDLMDKIESADLLELEEYLMELGKKLDQEKRELKTTKLAYSLDKIADILESKGLAKEAKSLDTITDTLEKSIL